MILQAARKHRLFFFIEPCQQNLEAVFAVLLECLNIWLHFKELQCLKMKSYYRMVKITFESFYIRLQFQFQMNIKCITYSRLSTSIPIYTVIQQKGNSAIATDAQKMTSKIKALRSKVDERQKLRTTYGVWWVTFDDNDICYAVCTDQSYPERHSFGLIQKLKQKVNQINHAQYETQDNIKNFTKKTADELAVQYNDLTKIDKLSKANSQVKQLEAQIGVGIKKIMTNQESLSEMDQKAEKMKSYANEFHKNSEKLERMLYWRNMKIKILIGLCVLGLVGFVILIIVQTTKKNQ